MLVEIQQSRHTPVFPDERPELLGVGRAVVTELPNQILPLGFGDVDPLFHHDFTPITDGIAVGL